MSSISAVILLLQGLGLMISEILFDPEPVVSLPNYEFVEWHNAGDDTVELAGWKWMVGDKVRTMTSGKIPPGGYVIVCSPAAAAAYKIFGQVVPLESFPSLRNTGDRLVLINPEGVAVHTVNYSTDSFTDQLKANGGWSLELTDCTNYCNPLAWMPSNDPSGGTPGRANSQQVTVNPPEPPRLIRAAGYDKDLFVLLFTEPLVMDPSMNNYSCTLSPGMMNIPAVPAPEYGFPGLFFQLPENLNPDTIYSIDIQGVLSDCTGQPAVLRTVKLGTPSEPEPSDIVITEILFNPRSDQAEFVEVYNRSTKVIDLKDLIVARAGPDGNITTFSDQQDLSFWLFPDQYAVFVADEQQFMRSWPQADPEMIVNRPDCPTWANEETQVLLLNQQQRILEVVTYNPDWQYPYLNGEKGFSLERLDFAGSGIDRSNWFSAAAASGGATPGMKNSMNQTMKTNQNQTFTIDPWVGFASASTDIIRLTVHYRFEESGWFMKIKIYNSSGQLARELFPYATAAAEGTVSWDGLDDASRMVPEGIYLVVIDYYHPVGKKGRWKKACAVARAY